MPFASVLVMVIDLFFIVHALRTGRPYWWVFVITGIPIFGSVIYYFVEIFPNSREGYQAERTVKNVVKGLGTAIDPTRDLRERAADVELCGSIDNRIALARECLAANLGEDAIHVLKSCQFGAFANDPHIKRELAEACLLAPDYELGLQTVADLQRNHPSYRGAEIALLKGRLYEALGNTEPALSAYAEAVTSFVGEEARCRYGLLLIRSGQVEQGTLLLNTMLKNAERLDGGFRALQREWIGLARKALAEQKVKDKAAEKSQG